MQQENEITRNTIKGKDIKYVKRNIISTASHSGGFVRQQRISVININYQKGTLIYERANSQRVLWNIHPKR